MWDFRVLNQFARVIAFEAGQKPSHFESKDA